MRSLLLLGLVATVACTTSGGSKASSTTAGVEPQPAEVATKIAVHLAKRLGIRPEDLKIERIDDVQWATAALGCPEPDQLYAQVVTPGWRVVIRAPEGVRYDVHAVRDGSRWLVCQAGRRLPVGEGVRQ